MVLTVLLVEGDRSTRQIIAALLKKCSYRVIAVPDGLKAWETLKRKAPDLDLILTEVELPAISGFALLSLIMEHDVCKNIPVIMMSSHNSVSMVLKCMLKGAADFLIKPVRRNELTNLWQHVWRRHAISRPPQDTTFSEKKLKAATEDISASNQSSGSVDSSQKNDECSEKLSEAQSTCTSPFLEAESSHMENMQNPSQLKSSSKLSNIDTVKHEEFTKFVRETAKHNDETGEKSNTFAPEAARWNKTFKLTDLRLEQDHGSAETENKDETFRAELSTKNPSISTKIHGCSHELEEPSRGAINLITTFENPPKHTNENCCLDGGNITKFDFDTQLELSLKRDFPGSSCKQASEANEEWRRLNHSNTSAFSWYSGSKLFQSLFSRTPITSAIVNNANWDSPESHKSSGITAVNDCQYDGSNQNQENVTSKIFTSVFPAQPVLHPIRNVKPVCQKESSPFPSSTSSQSNAETHNSDQHNHRSNDANYTCPFDKMNLDHAKHDSSATGQSANNFCNDAANHINSAYGSIDCGNDGKATSTMIAENNPEIFSGGGCQNYDGFRLTDSHRSSQREAALTKFRLKRKERCYEKKVRYQSRKRLAEQRPRVKGQFVRQVHNDHPVADAGGDS
ncbi:Signal transduction response regulator, receiver domain [Sesbania bispinosa]|nr:Signal transduction response regulator, receiver domain [Sesbania bispinosa]